MEAPFFDNAQKSLIFQCFFSRFLRLTGFKNADRRHLRTQTKLNKPGTDGRFQFLSDFSSHGHGVLKVIFSKLKKSDS